MGTGRSRDADSCVGRTPQRCEGATVCAEPPIRPRQPRVGALSRYTERGPRSRLERTLRGPSPGRVLWTLPRRRSRLISAPDVAAHCKVYSVDFGPRDLTPTGATT